MRFRFSKSLSEFTPALITSLRSGYSRNALTRDILSGITVGIVALPLAMAFAISSGTTPERGLFTAIVAGFIISALGGSRFQIGGPTGAFVVIVAGTIARHGYEGLVVATLLAGLILLVMGFLRMGKLLQYIPYPVTTGFTTGIALLIFSSQLNELLGIPLHNVPAAFIPRMSAVFGALHTANLATVGIAALTLCIIFTVRKTIPRIPAHIVGIITATAAAFALGLDIETIGTRFGGIPSGLPEFTLPQNFFALVPQVLPDAVTIALLAGIESLLSAVVADGMTGERHNSSMELVAQGLANLGAVMFGGIPATGAIARTATNIRAGAFSPLSGVIHAVTLALFVLLLAPLASLIPLASLAAVLVVVAWDMSEMHRFLRLLHAPRTDAVVLIATFALTVLVDLTVAVQVGIVMAAFLFMKRMSDITEIAALDAPTFDGEACQIDTHGEVLTYKIDGPFFFGVAQRFVDTIQRTQETPKVVILRMRSVFSLDATALEALETATQTLQRRGCVVILSGVKENVRHTIRRMGTDNLFNEDCICNDYPTALNVAYSYIANKLDSINATEKSVSAPAV